MEAVTETVKVAPVALGQVDCEAPGLPVPLMLPPPPPPPPAPSEGLCWALGVLETLEESEDSVVTVTVGVALETLLMEA